MIPKSVKVGAIVYEVFEVPYVEIDHDMNYLGSCSYVNTTIKLKETLSADRKEDVFFHELIHAMLFEAGYDDHDEDMVNRLGKVLHQVFKDNQFSFESREPNDKTKEKSRTITT